MKKILSLLSLLMLCVVGMNAAETSVTYALSEGDTFTSGQTVEVKNGDVVVATITYGESGGADFKAAKAASNIEGYTAFTEGNGENGNKTGGTFYTIVPTYDGTVSVAVCLNADKAFYVLEDGTALSDYDGIKESAKYYGTYSFAVKAGSSYKVYCSGSKLGFFGFEYTYGTSESEEPVVTNKTIALVPGVWVADGATFAAYVWNGDGNTWIPFVAAGDYYATQIPDTYTGLTVTRINPDGTDADPWKNVWNQTDDIDFTTVTDGSVITITGWEKSNFTITNPLQEARDQLNKVIALAEMLDAETLATEIAAAKEAAAGTDIEAMKDAMTAIMSKALPIAQDVLDMAKEFSNKYGYTDVAEAISAVEAAIPAAISSNDLNGIITATNNLVAVAIPAAQDAISKFKSYAEVLDNEALDAAVAKAEASLATGKIKDIITDIKAAEEPFLNAAKAFVAKVQEENIEDANVQAALAAVGAAINADTPNIVTIGDAIKQLIDAYNAYKLAQNPVYTVAGTVDLTGYEWDTTKNEMTKNEETGLYEWTAKFIKVTNDQKPEFKVVKNYDTWYPENNWVITPEVLDGEGIYTSITITFNAETTEIGVTGVKRADPVFAENNVYYWESPDGYVDENGGEAVHNNGGRVNYHNDKYYTICLNGKADYSTDIVTITLSEDVSLKAGDKIAITAYRNKNTAGSKSGAKLKFNDASSTTINIGDGLAFSNINTAEAVAEEFGEPNTITAEVPETADGATTITLTRSSAGTNLFITKIDISRPEVEEVDPVELAAIDPAPGLYDALPTEWVLTYGGKTLTVNEEAEVKLTQGETEYSLYIMLDEEDDTKVIISFDGRAITTPGEWLVEIPGNTITVDGVAIADPQSFKYTVKNPVDFTIDPAEGTVESLSKFTITFNNYMVEEAGDASVFLFNRETEAEIQPTFTGVINGGKAIYIEFDEVTTPGEWQLNVLEGFKNMSTDSYVPELFFEYTIEEKAVEKQEYGFYFTNKANWENVYAYVWNEGATEEALGAWPGTKLEVDAMYAMFGLTNVYSLVFEAAEMPVGIIFNNGEGEQTEDFVFEDNGEYANQSASVDVAVENISGLNTIEAEGNITLTLNNAQVTYKYYAEEYDDWYDETVYVAKAVIEDETGGVLIEDPVLVNLIEKGKVLNGNLPLVAEDKWGTIEFRLPTFTEDYEKYMAACDLIAAAETKEVVPLEVNDDNLMDFLGAYQWRLAKYTEATLHVTAGSWGDDLSVTLDVLGNTYAISDNLYALSEDFNIADGTKVVVEGYLYDLDLSAYGYGKETYFAPVSITEASEQVTEPAYYLVGNMNDWAVSEDYILAKNTEADAEEYMITLALDADAEFKIVKVDGENWTWYPGDGTSNYKITEADTYTVYFRPNYDGGDDWHYKVIYAEKGTSTGINSVNAFGNDAVIFNMQGVRVQNAHRGLYIVNGKKVVVK